MGKILHGLTIGLLVTLTACTYSKQGLDQARASSEAEKTMDERKVDEKKNDEVGGEEPPTVIGYENFIDTNTVKITFSKPIQCSELIQRTEHSIEDFVVTFQGDGNFGVRGTDACGEGRNDQVVFQLGEVPEPGVLYTFTLKPDHVVDEDGNPMATAFSWSRSFTEAELNPVPASINTSGWDFAEPVPSDFTWIQTLGMALFPAQADLKGSSVSGCYDDEMSPIAVAGLRLKKTAHISLTPNGTFDKEGISAACKPNEYWNQENPDWSTQNLSWVNDAHLDYEAVTSPGYALDGFAVRKCKENDVIIGLTPFEVKVSSAGVHETSVRAVPSGYFKIDDETVCAEEQEVSYRCNDLVHQEGLLNTVQLNYLKKDASTPLQLVGIRIACSKVCLAGEPGCPTQ